MSPDETAIVSASNDNTLRIWDVKTEQEKCTLAGPMPVWIYFCLMDIKVKWCCFSLDGEYILSACGDVISGFSTGYVYVWKHKTGECVFTLDNHQQSVNEEEV